MIARTPFGCLPDGRETMLYELSAGGVTVRVCDFGATLQAVLAPDRDGKPADIVLGYGDVAGYCGENAACYGATIGPVANRTDRGEVPIAGSVHQLPKNDGPARENNLHSDLARGLHKRLWNAEADEAANAVRFTCTLVDGELGLPGNRTFTAAYALAQDARGGASLTLTYRCATDTETYVNMTNHAYFNLAGHASGTVLGQLARVEASRYLPIRADSVSTGEVRDVTGTPFDFRAAKPLGRDIDADDEQLHRARGYDHCLCIDGYARDAAPRSALHVEDAGSGRALDIQITAPGAHLYTGNWLDDAHAKDGAAYAPHSGFAFEPEFWPDSVHHDAWEHPVCAPGHPFRTTIVYRFSTC